MIRFKQYQDQLQVGDILVWGQYDQYRIEVTSLQPLRFRNLQRNARQDEFELKPGFVDQFRAVIRNGKKIRLKDFIMMQQENIKGNPMKKPITKPTLRQMIREAVRNVMRESAWSTNKDSQVTYRGQPVVSYEFDRDSDSFWTDDYERGRGQRSHETKEEMIRYIEKMVKRGRLTVESRKPGTSR